MDVIVKETGTFDREVTITIAADRVDALLDQELGRLAKSARLPGFRPGKIPKKVLEAHYRDQLSRVIVEQLVQESYLEVLSKENLHPVDNEPRLTLDRVARGTPFTYTASIQIFPAVDPQGYTGLALTRRRAEIVDADVDAVVQQLRNERSRFEVEEGRVAAMGDQLSLDFDGRIDGERFAGGQSTQHLLELGSGRFIDTFEEQLLGCVAGEQRQVKVTFPTEYRATELAGKEATFDCLVHEVRARILPPEDDGLAKLAGLKEGGLAELRAEIRQTLQGQAERESRQQLKRAIIEQLLAANKIEVPSRLVQSESRVMVAQARREYEQQGMRLADLGISEEALANQFTDAARDRVIIGLVLGEIAEREKIVLDEAKLDAQLEEMSASYGERAAAMKKWVRDSEERMDTLRSTVLEQQVIDWIAENGTITDEDCSFDALTATHTR
ncbi:MAG: trigger factor [Magnetococcus sp. YQC-3]